VAGRALLRYKFSKANLEMSYVRMTTAGSGFFAGAESDIARLQLNRPLTRKVSGFADLGYARNSRIEPVAFSAIDLRRRRVLQPDLTAAYWSDRTGLDSPTDPD
jgi:hypothetical protein